ncbi:phospholipase D family protein [Curtobacterium ammoniigenes]|uniref:phospholipase D family protein n=1 Tax=Curtobacterium ammoniigenes TaxID=395387 RepID=UPI000AF1ECDC|nr:phospholipase D-like domain-containing protein [Curtobacterium ammoniigenes]
MTTRPREWFLARSERGNLATHVHAGHPGESEWSDGNLVVPLVHGATYFARLHAELTALEPGDRVWFTDWRGDADERLRPGGPTIGDLLANLARAGVEVRGLLWRSHGEKISGPMSGRSNELLGRKINDAGGEALLDQRVRAFGSHHQKFFVIQHPDEPERDVAFVGGLDLCHSRRDDAEHGGDPQAVDMDPRYGRTPPWHDAALELHGPVIADLLALFAERWNDPTPLDRDMPYLMLLQRLARMPRHPAPLPATSPAPPAAGSHSVQLLRTFGVNHPPFPFAPEGERTVARGLEKAFARAERLVYIEDQYLWSTQVVSGLARALRAKPNLQVIVVLPRYPDQDGTLTGPPSRLGQIRALRSLHRAGPGRVGVFDLENAGGTPIYVHAKICIVDDSWFTCGSANINRRSWTSDSELTCAVVDDDPDPTLARSFRTELWAEHLGIAASDSRIIDLDDSLSIWSDAAAALDAWHAGGRRGARPAGQLRTHTPAPVGPITRIWAGLLARFLFDPDGRPRRERGTNRF